MPAGSSLTGAVAAAPRTGHTAGTAAAVHIGPAHKLHVGADRRCRRGGAATGDAVVSAAVPLSEIRTVRDGEGDTGGSETGHDEGDTDLFEDIHADSVMSMSMTCDHVRGFFTRDEIEAIEAGYAKLANDPEYIKQAKRRRLQREVLAALARLDGSQRKALASIAGLSDEQLDALGGN